MKHYNKLTKNRKAFIEQLYNLINTQFEEQKKLKGLNPLEIIEELENNSDYIQRIFIDAPWGMGKTYFAKSLEELISYRNLERRNSNMREIKFITINAWETDYFSDPMKSIIGEIVENISLSDNIIEKVDELIDTKPKKIMQFFANFYLDKMGVNEERKDKLKDIFFNSTSVDISNIKEYIQYKKTVKSFKEALSRSTSLKVILIDELDRCKPNYAIELLETVKHFFGVKNLIFIFLINKKQLKESIGKTDDNCTEYFEKFFDIQFKLPELEYEDFIEIEYNKYNDIHTYNIKPYPTQYNLTNNIRIDYVADDVNSFYEFLFLEAFKSNCDSSIVSPRNLIKSFKKFRLLLSSLSLKEKGCYPLMIVLVLYFIREEYLKNDEGYSLESLYYKTFFILNNEKESEEENNSFSLKLKFLSMDKLINGFYFNFYKTLKYKNGFLKEPEISNKIYKNQLYFLHFEKTYNINTSTKYVNYNLKNGNITFNQISFLINKSEELAIQERLYQGMILENLNLDSISIVLTPNFFKNIDLSKYKLDNEYFTNDFYDLYHTDILEIWAKDKYEFILFQQDSKNN